MAQSVNGEDYGLETYARHIYRIGKHEGITETNKSMPIRNVFIRLKLTGPFWTSGWKIHDVPTNTTILISQPYSFVEWIKFVREYKRTSMYKFSIASLFSQNDVFETEEM